MNLLSHIVREVDSAWAYDWVIIVGGNVAQIRGAKTRHEFAFARQCSCRIKSSIEKDGSVPRGFRAN